MIKPFLVIGYPRSRTAWMANYLTVGDSVCIHEPVQHSCLELYLKLIGYNTSFSSSEFLVWPGTIENWNTMGVMKVLLIERDFDAAIQSFEKTVGEVPDPGIFNQWYVNFHYLKNNLLDCLCIPYNDIDSRIEEIHNYLIPHIPFSIERAQMLADLRVTQITENVIKSYAPYPENEKRTAARI